MFIKCHPWSLQLAFKTRAVLLYWYTRQTTEVQKAFSNVFKIQQHCIWNMNIYDTTMKNLPIHRENLEVICII